MSQSKNSRTNLLRRLAGAELLEARCLLSVNPIDFGVVYYEGTRTEYGSGVDSAADYIYVSFAGGAENTQLKTMTIDMAAYGLNDRHAYVDAGKDNPAGVESAYNSVPFKIYSADGFTVKDYSITVQNTLITISFENFTAGDYLILQLDVDESLNSGLVDAEVTGAEFASTTTVTATFTADYYEDFSVTSLPFVDIYQKQYEELNLPNLPNDSYTNSASIPPSADGQDQSVYTAGALFQGVQIPLPATISGKVYEDVDYDFAYDQNTDRTLENVQIILWKLDETTNTYQQVNSTRTNSQGEYSFSVTPGTYRVTEVTPEGYLDVSSFIGSINGTPVGTIIDANGLTDISIQGGQNSIHNDFSEYVPGSISGHVFEDKNDNGILDGGETLLQGVPITLTNVNTGKTYTTTTDKNGYWEFTGLTPGKYCVTEATPAGYLDGKDHVGSLGGTQLSDSAAEDKICAIYVYSGQDGVNYDFGEILPASVSGKVWLDSNKNGTFDESELLLENVKIELRDTSGNLIATTYTDQNGFYIFDSLTPGTYQIYEYQPEEYLNGGQAVGSHGGSSGGQDLTVGIQLNSGDDGILYDFWEYEYAQISGYVFQDGDTLRLEEGSNLPEDIWETYPGIRGENSTPIKGVTLVLADKDGNPILDENGRQITTVTDEKGYYCFKNLSPGTYTILELQPENYVDGIDTPGTLGGKAVNPSGDTLSNIILDYGDHGQEYNFSEILVEWYPTDPGGGGTSTLYGPPGYPSLSSGSSPIAGAYGYSPYFYGRSSSALGGGGLSGDIGPTWHLSVINAGTPRVYGENTVEGTRWVNAVFDPNTWQGEAMKRIQALLTHDSQTPMMVLVGLDGARPLTGDFNGDGKDELAVFYDGFWFIDLNANFQWDDDDLWVQLGTKGDQPIVGDWDGDGKVDIGIFGPAWKEDTQRIAQEPGLPDSRNRSPRAFKNIPPEVQMAQFFRDMKKTSMGEVRRDVIDHVFQFGQDGDIAVTGDWTGDGVTQIGVFRNGEWILDTDGDGQLTDNDTRIFFGQKGDIPIVGNWENDGLSRVGVYRDGRWEMLGANGEVRTLQRGTAGEFPLVGDFTGNGTPDLVTYRMVSPEELNVLTAQQNSGDNTATHSARHDDGNRIQ
ncbi:MAG: SdrD B-like domain-containing protein [Planctomycetia bacterium]|nr:SdrD B-like domain-containing protein [Planctomycetia bacterium]